MHDLCQTYHRLRNHFWTHTMVHLGHDAQVEARFGPFRDSANLDARLVHGLREHTIGLEIDLDTPDGTPR
jgi:hypothetical protein